MLVIGLCGGSGSGKGTVASLLAPYGIPSIDTDGVYHGLIASASPCTAELVAAFGAGILTPAGGIDRPALARAVFTGEGADRRRQTLNRITHAHILRAVREQLCRLRQDGVPAVLVDAPLLFESGFDRECDLTLAVLCDGEERLQRLARRDPDAVDTLRARIAAQHSDGWLREHCDLLLDNGGDLDALRAQVDRLAVAILSGELHELANKNKR